MRMKTAVVLSVALTAAGVAGGCATGRGAGTYDELTSAQPAPEHAATVRVENNNWQDVDVYAIRSGQKIRLGMVTSMTSTDFALPASLLTGSPNVQLYIHPIGTNGGYLSQSMLVAAGQTIDLRVENNINLTSYSVW